MERISIESRRILLAMTVGQREVLPLGKLTADQLEQQTYQFGNFRGLYFEYEHTPDGLAVTRVAEARIRTSYPQIDRLKVGESVVIDAPQNLHTRVRLAASKHNAVGFMRLTCTKEGDAIRVTRIPHTPEEAAQVPGFVSPSARSKYDLDRLHSHAEIMLELDTKDVTRARVAVSAFARKHDLSLSCQAIPGGLRVFRRDMAQPIDAPKSRAEGRPSKYGLERLAAERELTFHPASPIELRNLRLAVSTKGINEGWKLRCRKQDDGSVKVHRLDLQEAANA